MIPCHHTHPAGVSSCHQCYRGECECRYWAVVGLDAYHKRSREIDNNQHAEGCVPRGSALDENKLTQLLSGYIKPRVIK